MAHPDQTDLTLLQKLASLPQQERRELVEGMTTQEVVALGSALDGYRPQMAGSGLELMPHQQAPDGDWWVWLLAGGRGAGKRLALDTPLPTPDGWTTMGAVAVGDVLYDHAGQPTTVTEAHPVVTAPACRVTFSDGTSIVADPGHLWTVWGNLDRKSYNRVTPGPWPADWPGWTSPRGRGAAANVTRGPRTLTTAQMAAAMAEGDTLTIPLASPLSCQPADLPVDPWLLGMWLGDGDTTSPVLTCSPADLQHITAGVAAAGEAWESRHPADRACRVVLDPRNAVRRNTATGRMERNPGSLHDRLDQLGVIGSKHIPQSYLRGTIQQRRALMGGLIDSDGHVDHSRRSAEYTTTLSRRYAEQVAELACTLGYRPVVSEGRATIAGKDCGPKWRVLFTCHDGAGPGLHIPRKRLDPDHQSGQATRRTQRTVTHISRTALAIPMRCIAVDSPHRLFLAGESMIPTHNSLGGAAWLDSRARELPGSRWAVVAPTRPDARAICVEGETGLLSINPTISFNRSRYTLTWPNGSTARLFGAYSREDRQRIRGPQFHGAWCEEYGAWRQLDERPSPMDPDVWEQLTIACRLGDFPQIAVTTTPKRRQRLVDLYEDTSGDVVLTHARMVDNPHLSEAYRNRLLALYEGTTLGAQELDGQLIDAVDGALLSYEDLDHMLVRDQTGLPDLTRRVVSVDPATTDHATSDETGVIVAGAGVNAGRPVGATLADMSGRHPVVGDSGTWAHVAVEAYHQWDCVAVVAEANQGGDMVAQMIRNVDPDVPVKLVRASVGKRARAEPVAAAARTGRWWHVGSLPELREQWATWDPSSSASPDRLDAEVWAAHYLVLGSEGVGQVTSPAERRKDYTPRPGGAAARRIPRR